MALRAPGPGDVLAALADANHRRVDRRVEPGSHGGIGRTKLLAPARKPADTERPAVRPVVGPAEHRPGGQRLHWYRPRGYWFSQCLGPGPAIQQRSPGGGH